MAEQANSVPEIMNLAEASRFIRVSEKTLGEMARQNRIPCNKVGREWRFLKSALEDWLKGTHNTDLLTGNARWQISNKNKRQ